MCQDLEVLMSCKINGLIPFQFHISKITFFFLCPSSASVYTLTFALPVYYNFCGVIFMASCAFRVYCSIPASSFSQAMQYQFHWLHRCFMPGFAFPLDLIVNIFQIIAWDWKLLNNQLLMFAHIGLTWLLCGSILKLAGLLKVDLWTTWNSYNGWNATVIL